MRRRNKKDHFSPLTVTHLRANHCVKFNFLLRRLTGTDARYFNSCKCCLSFLVHDIAFLSFKRLQLCQETILDNLIAENRVGYIISCVKRHLIRFFELKIHSAYQHSALRIDNPQTNIGNIIIIFAFEIISRPTFTRNQVFVIKIFTKIILEFFIAETVPFYLHTCQVIILQKITMETHAKATRK